MRDEAPVATFSHLVPESRLLEIRIQASRGHPGSTVNVDSRQNTENRNNDRSKCIDLDYISSLTIDNNRSGNAVIRSFAERYLLPFFHEDLQRLTEMVHRVPNFPRAGIDFRHVLGISQQKDGLALCTSLFQNYFTGDWNKIDKLACCEAGGYVFASALALQINVPLALIREARKLPPPTISVDKCPSHISTSMSSDFREKRIEMDPNAVSKGSLVVVIDDVLATGKTLCAVLQLLEEAGIRAKDVSIMIVAEFPVHRGRKLLRQPGFGRVNIQSLLTFGGD